MALNLKTLGTRSLSALVFVILLVGCVYWNYYSFSLFFFAVSMIGLHEFYKISQRLNAEPYQVSGFIFGIFIYLSNVAFMGTNGPATIIYYIVAFKLVMVLFPFLILARGMFSKKENSMRNALFTIGGVMYAVLPFGLLNQTVFHRFNEDIPEFNPMIILGVIFLIWSNDTFAYLGGSLFGKNKMIERISPGKTWEGTLIGIVITFGLSFTFNQLVYPLETYTWQLLGIFVPILATIGDLVESKLKREAGIKDSGKIMPGHGGILDRFDSLIFVSPFVFALFTCLGLKI